MKTLDKRRPYARIFGHSQAAYYQNGRYFRGDGSEISAGNAAKPFGMTSAELKELQKEDGLADETIVSDSEDTDDQEPDDTEATEDEDGEGSELPENIGLPEREDVEDTDWIARFDEAMTLHPTTLTKMAEERYGELEALAKSEGVKLDIPPAPYSGKGSKEQNARWLATYAA